VKRLDERVAIVTGAARGVGASVASVLRAEGADVVIADIDDGGAQAQARAIDQTAEHALAVRVDVTKRGDLDAMVQAALRRWGRVDILVANAGIYPHVDLDALEPETFDSLMAINVRGAVFAVQACLAPMRAAGYGRVVLTSSITGGVVGQPGYAHYGASKAAMIGFMRSAALEVATSGITINAVLPGNVRTPGFDDLGAEHQRAMLAAIPLGRFAEPEEIGWAVRFLASEEAGYITGQTLVIDGGQVLPESA
jgi:3-oxoacyl-[acyl-carrier protein] reductase